MNEKYSQWVKEDHMSTKVAERSNLLIVECCGSVNEYEILKKQNINVIICWGLWNRCKHGGYWNILISRLVEQNEEEVKECVEEEVMDVDIDVMSMFKCFDMFYNCIVALLFTRNIL